MAGRGHDTVKHFVYSACTPKAIYLMSCISILIITSIPLCSLFVWRAGAPATLRPCRRTFQRSAGSKCV